MGGRMCVFLSMAAITVVIAAPVRAGELPGGSPLRAFLSKVRVGSPVHYEGLWVFPVTLDGQPHFAPLTMDAARERGVLLFKELDRPQVNAITVINTGDQPIFLMAGEVIKGARQDRILQQSLLVPPKTTLTNAVFCVEPGRWTGGLEFESAKSIAAPAVRAAAQGAPSQEAVWDAVGKVRAGVDSPYRGSSLLEAQSSAQAAERAAGFMEQLRKTPLPGETRGVLIFYGQLPVAADFFASPELFQALWPKLRDSYLMSVFGGKPSLKSPTLADATLFLRAGLACVATAQDTPGAGRVYELSGPMSGSALLFDYEAPLHRPGTGGAVEVLVHAELFPHNGKEPVR